MIFLLLHPNLLWSFQKCTKIKYLENYKEYLSSPNLQEIKYKLSELKKKEDEFRNKLIEFAKQKGIDIVYGSNMNCSVKEFDKIILPEDKEEKAKFIKLLKDLDVYEECSMVCYPKLNSKIIKDEMDKKIKDAVDIVKDFRLSLNRGKEKGEE